MPQITDNSGTYKLPGSTGRKKLVVENTGSTTLIWGWESAVAATGPNRGVSLAANAVLILDDSPSCPLTNPLYFAWTAGSTASISYTCL